MNYSESDRERLLNAAAAVVLATVTADRTGALAYFREMMAAGRFLYDAERRYAHNALVRELLAAAPASEADGGEEPLTREQLLAHISQIGDLVKDDEEGREFKRFLFELAEAIARASGRAFSSRISMDEQEYLTELRARLRLPESAA